MGFLAKFLRVVTFIPQFVLGAESLFSAFGKQKSGKEKADTVIDFSKFALGMGEAVAQKDIVDEKEFSEGLKDINNGVVRCLNASLWYKRK